MFLAAATVGKSLQFQQDSVAQFNLRQLIKVRGKQEKNIQFEVQSDTKQEWNMQEWSNKGFLKNILKVVLERERLCLILRKKYSQREK